MITRTVAASCGRRAPLPAGLEVLCARERDALILRLFVGLGVDRTSGRTTERRQLEAGVFALAAFGSIATASVVTLLALIAVLVLI
ncbi:MULTISPECIES: hypothetical protein [Rhodococcus]|uniref:hypothetical protein n=1 Tax=Rhodococcus TaxID=1827 RepID=UPI00058744A2|nr:MULTISPECIES: hypothetical protein [Rhodococcus]QQZ16548.1 hypothetical protein GO592_10425 [Rhodococcus sp. 21391]